VNTLRAQLSFPFQTQFLQIHLNFQQQNPLKNQYFSHLSSEKYEINSIKSDSQRTFQQHQEHPPKFQYSFQLQFYLVFIEKMVQ